MKTPVLCEKFLFIRTILFLSFLTTYIVYSTPNMGATTVSPQTVGTCENAVETIPQMPDKKCQGTSCVNYELVYLILLEHPESQFYNVFDFLKINTRGCSASSSFWFITPQCSQYINGADCQVKDFQHLYYAMETFKQPKKFSPLTNSSVVSDMYQMMNYALMQAAYNNEDLGGSLTLITDMSCAEFCKDQLPLYFYQTFRQFGDMGYQMQLYLTGNDSSSGACTRFFDSVNVTHTIGLPLAGAESGCLDPIPDLDYCNHVTTGKVTFGKPFSNSNNKLIVMGFLLQNWDMEPYESFVRKVTSDCNYGDIIQMIAPGKIGPEINITSANMDSLLLPTDIYTFYVTDPFVYQTTLLAMIYELNNTAFETDPDYNTYIYIFTDVDCFWLCSLNSAGGGQPTPLYFVDTLKTLYKSGYLVNIFQVPKLTATCDSFSSYWSSTGLPPIQTIPTVPSYMDEYSICLSKRTTIADYETSTSRQFVLATDKPQKMSDWKLGLLIGITCFCLILLALTVTFGICQRRRRKARKLAISKASKLAESVRNDELNDDYWRLPAENLLVNDADILGRGAFGSVYKGKYKGNIPSIDKNAKLKMSLIQGVDGTYEIAVKRLPLYATEFQRQELTQEIEFMKNLGHHINVIAILGFVDHCDDPMILLEYCENGDLHGHLQRLRRTKSDEELNTKEFVAIAWQIINGLCYLHAHNFVHRDLAARNILLTKNMVAKISDFGLCRHNDSAHYTSKGGKLPLRWMAIESLKFYEFSTNSDIWSYGVTVWELFSLGESPFQAIQGDELASYLEAGNRLEMPDTCPESLSTLIYQCWSSSPESRPEAEEIRAKISALLDESSMYYGYLNFENKEESSEETLPD